MDPREQAMKSQLDGTFVKWIDPCSSAFPFKTEKVDRGFMPDYGRPSYSERMAENTLKRDYSSCHYRRRPGPKPKVFTPDQVAFMKWARSEKWPYDAIAKHLQVGKDRFYAFVKASGI